jgi:methylmalonyl-CoA/ethylmalonyl-CoA epimerase
VNQGDGVLAPPDLPGVIGIHHVALAVADLDAALSRWLSAGATLHLRAVVADQAVEAAALAWPAGGPTELELIAPLGADSGVARFIDKRGEGMHHVAWAVQDVQACLDVLTRAGARVIDATPRPGLHGTPVAFVHPSSMGGVLAELVQVSDD